MSATPAEIARRALADHLAALPAADLLALYARRRDPEAFAGLVRQFGPMVLGVCRRVLGSSADADDAFQAVFLALARRAGSFRDAAALPAWLHRVALRTARKALARRDNSAPLPDAVPDPSDPLAHVAWKDVRRVLDEELDALPAKFRGPVVLCWLDGLTQDEAAGRLGFSLNTLKRRLDAGRELLRSRLTRRGLAPVLAAAAVIDATGLRAVLPDALALLAVERGVPGATVPAGVEALSALAAATTPGHRSMKAALVLVLVAGAATAAGLILTPKPPPSPPVPQKPSVPPPPTEDEPRVSVPVPKPKQGPPQFVPMGKPLPAQSTVVSLVFSRWGDTLISGGYRALQLWDVEKGKQRANYFESNRPPVVPSDIPEPPSDEELRSLVLSPDGRVLVWGNGGPGATVWLWEFISGEKLRSAELSKVWRITAMALSPDGNTLATTSEFSPTSAIYLWSVSHWWKNPILGKDGWPREELTKPRAILHGHKGGDARTFIWSLTFSPDGKTLASGSEDGTIRLWDVEKEREKAVLNHSGKNTHPLAIAFSTDGRFLACSCRTNDSGEIKVWDLVAGTDWSRPNQPGYPRCLAFHPDGKTLLVGGERQITVWDATTGEKQATLTAHKGSVTALAFSPDGKVLASAGGKGDVFGGNEEKSIQLWAVSRPRE